jgi:DNA-binding NarL/FixJ family response regulator
VTMVSRGLTNREIATRMLLSVRTIEAHVRAVRRKVGLRSRTQIAAWAVLRDPPFPDSASWGL